MFILVFHIKELKKKGKYISWIASEDNKKDWNSFYVFISVFQWIFHMEAKMSLLFAFSVVNSRGVLLDYLHFVGLDLKFDGLENNFHLADCLIICRSVDASKSKWF